MRLYKKAAVCLLAAAMALSMLTACGGSTPEKPADSGNKPGTSQGGTENPGKDDPGKEDSKDDSSVSSGSKVDWQKSKAYKYSKKFESTSLQMEIEYKLLETTDENEKESVGKTYNVLYAKRGNEWYAKYSMRNQTGRYIYLKDKNYVIDDASKTCIIQASSNSGSDANATVTPINPMAIAPVCGTTTVDDVEYNTEKYTLKGKSEGVAFVYTITYCFDQQDDLAYVLYDTSLSTGEAKKYRVKYESVSNNVNAELFKAPELPDDYTVLDTSNMA